MDQLKISPAAMLEDEITWLDNFEPTRAAECETSEADNVLLAGHLRLIKILLSLCGTEKEMLGNSCLQLRFFLLQAFLEVIYKTRAWDLVIALSKAAHYRSLTVHITIIVLYIEHQFISIGSSLIKPLLDDFLFRASRIILNSHSPAGSVAVTQQDFHPK